MSRLEIEVRFFLFTSLGALVHSEQFHPELIDQEKMVSDMLTRYPLERWYEMQILSRAQIHAWFTQALIILTTDMDGFSE